MLQEERLLLNTVKSQPFILWISILRKHKRPLLVADIARRVPAINFVLVGSSVSSEGELIRKLEDSCKRVPNLYWLGSVSEELKEQLIHECIAGITTSIQEGFGMTPLEFLSHNKPVIAYPLEVFKEIYGDSLIYATTTEEFVDHISQFEKDMTKYQIDYKRINEIQNKYNIKRAALNMSQKLKTLNSPILILARDIPENSTIIQGNYILEWKLWSNLAEISKKVYIISTGTKYSKNIDIRKNIKMYIKHNKDDSKTEPGIPIYSLSWYFALSVIILIRYPAITLITSGAHLSILGALLHLLFPIKVISIVHDIGFVNQKNVSFTDIIKHKIIRWAYNNIDYVVTVSRTSANHISEYLHRNIEVIWDN